MSKIIFKNVGFWADKYALAGNMNQLGLDVNADQVDATSLADDTHINIAGLKDVAFSHAGFFDANPSDVFFNAIGLDGMPMTVGLLTGEDGVQAMSFNSQVAAYSPEGSIGDLMKFSVSGSLSSDDLIQGMIMSNKTTTGTENGTARQLGAVTASQKLYVCTHVTSASGTTPTLDIEVESDDNSGMSSPTTRVTVPQFTATDAVWSTPVSGAITDDYWRVTLTVGGTDPSFDVVVFIGIQ